MKRRRDEIASPEEEAVRFAWWAAFFATLIVVAALGLVSSAGAAVPPSSGGILETPAGDPFAEDEEEAEEEEPCEWEEDEWAWEACIEAEEAEAEAEARASECKLASAVATVSARPARKRVLLTIRYRTFSPALVNVRFGLRGNRGGLGFGAERKRFHRSGAYRDSIRVGPGQLAKVLAAREFTVQLHAVNAPRHCRPLFKLRLDRRRQTPRGPLWNARSAG